MVVNQQTDIGQRPNGGDCHWLLCELGGHELNRWTGIWKIADLGKWFGGPGHYGYIHLLQIDEFVGDNVYSVVRRIAENGCYTAKLEIIHVDGFDNGKPVIDVAGSAFVPEAQCDVRIDE